MHDPCTQAFRIGNPFSKEKYSALITIWHHDPDIGGDDDSCGWFIRSRHLPKELVKSVERDFKSDESELYYPDGSAKFSEIAMALHLYKRALWQWYLLKNKGDYTNCNRQRNRFLKKHLLDIISFAENPTDSICGELRRKGSDPSYLAEIIIADIARKDRPWYKHPRWHIHHWEIQFDFAWAIYQNYFKKCDDCGKRGWKGGWNRIYRDGKPFSICGRHNEYRPIAGQ